MGGAIVDKIIAKFEGKPFDEMNGTEPGFDYQTKRPESRGGQVLTTDSYGPMVQESFAQVLPWISQKIVLSTEGATRYTGWKPMLL
jgi:hypothetical protein